ncbi:MAG: GGDEF domain-containing protein [Terriglobia bacterium]|jgi:diguanylate cyclase (GGDEF)-like protein
MAESVTDGLTGLKTRCCFMEALDGEWRRSTQTGRQFSLTMMHLDRFEQANERMGRPEGDKVLTAVAALLSDRLKQPNVVARYEEDEFAILMPETNTQQAEIVAEELRAAVEADDILHAHEVTGSFGVATFPDHGATQERVLGAAEFRMYEAKYSKGNCVKAPHPPPRPGDADWSEWQKMFWQVVADFCGVYHRWLKSCGFWLEAVKTDCEFGEVERHFERVGVDKAFAVYRDFTGCQAFLSLERFGGWVVSQEKGKYIIGAGFDDLCRLTC